MDGPRVKEEEKRKELIAKRNILMVNRLLTWSAEELGIEMKKSFCEKED